MILDRMSKKLKELSVYSVDTKQPLNLDGKLSGNDDFVWKTC